jgi:phasin protein
VSEHYEWDDRLARISHAAEYAKSAQETFVAEATKIGELYKTFAKEAFTPFTSSFLPK